MRNIRTVFKLKCFVVIFLIIFNGLSSALLGQNDTILIKECIDQMFAGMATFDSSLVRRSFTEGLTLKSIVKSKEGETIVKEESGESFLKLIGTVKSGVKYDERLGSYTYMLDGDMAVVWTPYHFYLTGTFSHCGVNVFTMVKLPEGWKIMSITDTRRKSDCAD
jgi:hypothetical protein